LPQDANSMRRAAVADHSPVIIIEARAYYQSKGAVDFGHVDPRVGGCRIVRPGMDCDLLSYGTACALCEQAVDTLRDEGHQIRLVDLRWLNPVDWDETYDHVDCTRGLALEVG